MFQNKHCNIFYFDSFALQQKKVERIETRDGQRKEKTKAKLRERERERENMKLHT
jgi:cytidylate kinase